ncbi:MAG: hypothetical protein Q9169_004450 [Polycauliona sp. 2 TL-2023]
MHTLTAVKLASLFFVSCAMAQYSKPGNISAAAIARCRDSRTFTDPKGPDPSCWNTLQLRGRFQRLYTFIRETETAQNASLSAPQIVEYLNGLTTLPKEAALETVDKRIAKIMESRTDTDGISAMNQTSDDILSYFGSGHFLQLAADGALLNIFPQPDSREDLG